VAQALGTAPQTVKTHLSGIYAKRRAATAKPTSSSWSPDFPIRCCRDQFRRTGRLTNSFEQPMLRQQSACEIVNVAFGIATSVIASSFAPCRARSAVTMIARATKRTTYQIVAHLRYVEASSSVRPRAAVGACRFEQVWSLPNLWLSQSAFFLGPTSHLLDHGSFRHHPGG
jgi:hypothetical protein